MLPPPLPGYPQTQQQPPQPPPQAAPLPPPVYAQPAPVAQPQGYPGPAVAVPGVPQQGTPFPAYAQQPQAAPPQGYGAPPGGVPAAYPAPPQQGYAPTPIDIGAAIAAATGGDRLPQLGPGFQYQLEVMDTRVTVHPQSRKLTFLGHVKILWSNNPAQPQGAEAVYVEGLEFGAGRIQTFLIAGSGYLSKHAFDQAFTAAGHNPDQAMAQLGNAAGNADVQQPDNPFPPNPLKGGKLHASTQMVTKTPKTGKNAGQQTQYLSIQWAPLT